MPSPEIKWRNQITDERLQNAHTTGSIVKTAGTFLDVSFSFLMPLEIFLTLKVVLWDGRNKLLTNVFSAICSDAEAVIHFIGFIARQTGNCCYVRFGFNENQCSSRTKCHPNRCLTSVEGCNGRLTDRNRSLPQRIAQ